MAKRKPVILKLRLKLAEARASDAENQLNGMREQRRFWMQKYGWASVACELNMEAYESAQLHAKTNHTLLTEARAEIDRLTLEVVDKKAQRDALREMMAVYTDARNEAHSKLIDEIHFLKV